MTINHASGLPAQEHSACSTVRRLGLVVIAMVALCVAPIVRADEQVHLKIVGGLAGVSQMIAWKGHSGEEQVETLSGAHQGGNPPL